MSPRAPSCQATADARAAHRRAGPLRQPAARSFRRCARAWSSRCRRPGARVRVRFRAEARDCAVGHPGCLRRPYGIGHLRCSRYTVAPVRDLSRRSSSAGSSTRTGMKQGTTPREELARRESVLPLKSMAAMPSRPFPARCRLVPSPAPPRAAQRIPMPRNLAKSRHSWCPDPLKIRVSPVRSRAAPPGAQAPPFRSPPPLANRERSAELFTAGASEGAHSPRQRSHSGARDEETQHDDPKPFDHGALSGSRTPGRARVRSRRAHRSVGRAKRRLR